MYTVNPSLKTNQETESHQNILRFMELTHAIEFFSQRFSLENIVYYISEFTNRLMETTHCAVYTLDIESFQVDESSVHASIERMGHKETSKKRFAAAQKSGYEGVLPEVAHHKKVDEIVYFHAGLTMPKIIEQYFGREIIEVLQPNFGIPLIMDKSLFGMVFIQKKDALLQVDDKVIAEALMNLFHLALTNFKSFEQIEISRKELDEKVFNLFAINQSSKALMSELNSDYLNELSLSVFSELTQSKITSFFLYDDASEMYKLQGVIDAFHHTKIKDIYLNVNNKEKAPMRTLTDWKNETQKAEFLKCFQETNGVLEELKPCYIVALVQERHLLGFVTLSDKVNQEPYKASVFELIESLASSTYIAISNAKYLNRINEQNQLLKSKFERLIRLNKLMKNINTATQVDQLIDLTLETLSVSFGYTISFIAMYRSETNMLEVVNEIGFQIQERQLPMTENLTGLLKGEMIVKYRQSDVLELLGEMANEQLQDEAQGLVLIPMYIDGLEIELLGVIGILGVSEGVLASEERIITLETIGNHIAPALKHLEMVNSVQSHYETNQRTAFKQTLVKHINDAKTYDLEVYVAYMSDKTGYKFETTFSDAFLASQEHAFFMDPCNLFLIGNQPDWVNMLYMTYMEQYDVQIYTMGQDFDSLESFLSIFETSNDAKTKALN